MSTEVKYTNFRSIPYHRLSPIWKYKVDGHGAFEAPKGKKFIMPDGLQVVEIISESKNILAQVFPSIVHVFPSYAYNGPNGVPDLPVFMEPAIPHDILNQLMEEGRLPLANAPIADLQFKQGVRDNGGGWLFSRVSWREVRIYQKLSKGV